MCSKKSGISEDDNWTLTTKFNSSTKSQNEVLLERSVHNVENTTWNVYDKWEYSVKNLREFILHYQKIARNLTQIMWKARTHSYCGNYGYSVVKYEILSYRNLFREISSLSSKNIAFTKLLLKMDESNYVISTAKCGNYGNFLQQIFAKIAWK